jgi:hypothetical protein
MTDSDIIVSNRKSLRSKTNFSNRQLSICYHRCVGKRDCVQKKLRHHVTYTYFANLSTQINQIPKERSAVIQACDIVRTIDIL